MAVGGSGDVLSGILGAFSTFWKDPFEIAQAGALLNCLAGELASQEFYQGLTATDIIDFIPKIIKKIKTE